MLFHRHFHLQVSLSTTSAQSYPPHGFTVTVMSYLLKLVPVTHSIKQSNAKPIPNRMIRCTRAQLSEPRSRNYSIVALGRIICNIMRRLTPSVRMMRKTRAGPKSWRSASIAVRHTAPHFKLFAPLRTVGRGFVAQPLTLSHFVIPNASPRCSP